MTSIEPNADRTGYINGLRALADALDAHPETPLPYYGTQKKPLPVYMHTKADAAAWARTLPGQVTKTYDDDSDYFGLNLGGAFDGLHMAVYARRDQVCTRVVTSSETVTREIPARPAMPATVASTVTEVVETVEWDCGSLLASDPVPS